MKCRDCSNQAIISKSMCRECLDKANSRMKLLREDAISQGLCYRCRKNNSMEDSDKCENCFKKDSARHKKRINKYISENRCTKCAHSKSFVKIWSNRLCAGCHLKFKFKYNCTKEQAEKIINKLLEKQNYKCAITGRDLYTNKFHIDHIKSRSLFPELASDPNNWQLAVEEVNVFKDNLTIEQILKLAKDIVEFNKL